MPKPLRLMVLLVVVWAVMPLCWLMVQSFQFSGRWSFENYRVALGRLQLWTLLGNSVALAGASTVLAIGVGVPVALVVVKSTAPYRALIAVIFCAPLSLPPYVLAVGWFRILGRQGLLPAWAGPVLGLPDQIGAATSNLLFGMPGGVLVLATAFMPIVILLTMAALAGVNPALEDAARLAAPWRRVLREITFPLARRGIILSAVLTFLAAMGEFAAPSFLRLNVFPVASFTQTAAFYDSGAATAAWAPMLLVVLACIGLSCRPARSGEYYFRWATPKLRRIDLGQRGRWISALAILAGIVLVVAPCVAIVMDGWAPASLADAWFRAADSIGWTLLYSASAATAVCAVGILLGYVSQRNAVFAAASLSPIALVLFAIPGALAGFATVVAWNRPATAWLHGGSILLISSMAVQYLAVGQLGFAAALSQLPPGLEEAAQLAGAGWLRRIADIVGPPLLRPCLALWMLTFVLCMRETSLPLLLAPPGHDPLTARTLTLMANGSEELVSSLCLISIILSAAPGFLAWSLSVQIRRRHD